MLPISADRILYCDDHLLAVNKLSGELTVKGSGKMHKLPLFDLLKREQPGLRVLHRLDFETSGAVLFAKTRECWDRIRDGNFKGWKKIYRTIIIRNRESAKTRSGEIRAMLPARGHGTVEAITRYRLLRHFGNVAYVEAEIATGRHHQIRRHFAGIGCPLVLDHLYGDAKFNHAFTRAFGYRKFFLHAFCVELPHPVTGVKMRIEAPLPQAFEEVLQRLEGRG